MSAVVSAPPFQEIKDSTDAVSSVSRWSLCSDEAEMIPDEPTRDSRE